MDIQYNDLIKGKRKYYSFDYKDVVINDCLQKKQLYDSIDFFMEIPTDDLMRGYRVRKGLYNWENVPGNSLGGWYEGHMFSGSTLGQWLSAFSKMYIISGQKRVYEKLIEILTEFEKTLEDDGYFYYRKKDEMNVWHYKFDKMVLGLTDVYLYTHLEIAKDILDRITDWAINNLNQNRTLPTRKNFVGVSSEQECDNEWYTLSENLYRAYIVTGDKKYKDFAQVWHYEPFWEALRLRNPAYWPSLHAYSHVNSVGGAAYAYLVTGERRYKETIENFYSVFDEYEFFSNGGYGPGEGLVGNTGRLSDMMRTYKWTYEVPCSSWAGFKLGRYLVEITGQGRAGDWLEKQVFSNMAGTLPMRNDEKRGRTFYYACYAQRGATKFYFHEGWPCCSGTYPLALSEYINLIYFKNKSELLINLFIPSEAKYQNNNGKITLVQETNFPKNLGTKITVKVPEKTIEATAIKIRIPEWIDGEAEVYINGLKMEKSNKDKLWGVKAAKGTFAYLGNRWKDGDTIEVQFHAKLKFIPADNKNHRFGTFVYGPLTLAAKNCMCGDITINEHDLDKYFSKTDSENIEFTALDELGRKFVFVPYEDIDEDENTSVYFEISNK